MEIQMKRIIEKEYKENDVKITRYEAAPLKPIPMKGKPRKPSFGWKEPK